MNIEANEKKNRRVFCKSALISLLFFFIISQSGLAQDSQIPTGEELESMAMWEEAASAYVDKSKREDSPEPLQRAIEIYIALGDEAKAEECEQLFVQVFDERLPGQVAFVAFDSGIRLMAKAESDGGAQSWQAVVDYFENFLKLHKKIVAKPERTRSFLFVGNAHRGLGDPQKAESYYIQALNSFDPKIQKAEEKKRREEARAEARERRRILREERLERLQRRRGIVTYLSAANAPRNPFDPDKFDPDELDLKATEFFLPEQQFRHTEYSDENRREYEGRAAAAEALYNMALFVFEKYSRVHLPEFVTVDETPLKVERWWRKKKGPEEVEKREQTKKQRRLLARWGEWEKGEPLEEQKKAVEQEELLDEYDKQFEYWLETSLEPWMERKAELMNEAGEAFARVVPIGVPKWIIAAAARVGDMQRSFYLDLENAPLPPRFAADSELIEIYRGSMDSRSEPYRRFFEEAYLYCVKVSLEFSWFDDNARHCATMLGEIDPKRYPPLDEIVPEFESVENEDSTLIEIPE